MIMVHKYPRAVLNEFVDRAVHTPEIAFFALFLRAVRDQCLSMFIVRPHERINLKWLINAREPLLVVIGDGSGVLGHPSDFDLRWAERWHAAGVCVHVPEDRAATTTDALLVHCLASGRGVLVSSVPMLRPAWLAWSCAIWPRAAVIGEKLPGRG